MILILVKLFTMTYRAFSLEERTKRHLFCSHRRRQREKVTEREECEMTDLQLLCDSVRFPQHSVGTGELAKLSL